MSTAVPAEQAVPVPKLPACYDTASWTGFLLLVQQKGKGKCSSETEIGLYMPEPALPVGWL